MPPVRGTKREAIRVEPELWREYGLACEAADTNRSADLRDHMERKVRAWRRDSTRERPADRTKMDIRGEGQAYGARRCSP